MAQDFRLWRLNPQGLRLRVSREDVLVTRQQGRVAAWAAAVMLVMTAGVQFYAVLRAAFDVDPPAAGALVLAVLAGLLAVAAAVVLLIRVGYLRDRVPFAIGLTGARWVAYAALGGAVLGFAGQMDAEWYIAGPINLIISLLAVAVARSELPASIDMLTH